MNMAQEISTPGAKLAAVADEVRSGIEAAVSTPAKLAALADVVRSGIEAAKDPEEPLPPGWRPEWRRPRPKRAHPSSASARALACARDPHVASELPTDPEGIRELAIRVLVEIAADPDAHPASRVGAAKTLLEVHQPTIVVAGWSPRALPEATGEEPTPEEGSPDPSWK